MHTIERSSRALRVVGFGLLAAFLDPRDGGQPLSRNTADYVINAGAFQVGGTLELGSRQGLACMMLSCRCVTCSARPDFVYFA